jgi:hypothetical protein
VAHAREATRGKEMDWERKEATRGEVLSRRWLCGGGEAAARGQRCRRQSRAEQEPMCARRKKRGERSGGLVCDFQKV